MRTPHITRHRINSYKGAERYVIEFGEALSELKEMPRPCWRRPNEKGSWGIVSGTCCGPTPHGPLEEYPQLSHGDILATIAYGAEAARERIIPVPSECVAWHLLQ